MYVCVRVDIMLNLARFKGAKWLTRPNTHYVTPLRTGAVSEVSIYRVWVARPRAQQELVEPFVING